MNRIIVLATLCLFSFGLNAQKIEKKYYSDQTYSTSTYSIRTNNAVSTRGYLKFKISITNLTSSTLILKPEDIVVKIGNDSFHSQGEMTYIAAYSTRSDVLAFKGGNLMVDSFSIQNPGLYVESGNSKPLSLPDFDIPGSAELKDTNMYMKVVFLKRMKKLTFVKFHVRYSGEGLLKVETGKSMVRVPSGNEYTPNSSVPYISFIDANSTDSYVSFSYTLPDKIANMSTDKLTILWKDMFAIINLAPVDFQKMTIPIDAATTKKKNS